jgi:eukaryotic-like serine/threonine-protein kinase
MDPSITRLRDPNLDPKQWQRLKTIVADALEQTGPADRPGFVRRSCRGDEELLRNAESLLAEAEALLAESDDPFEQCAENATRTLWSEDPSALGKRVGAYTLIREIGRGGMGTVYLAYRADGAFEKQVAIKVLKRGTDTDEVLARFDAERRILARLDHPHIARLLDAGSTADGLPYFVMEYVEGQTVTRYVRAQRVGIRERLALFLKICSAVEKAHRCGVVHRDLKPGNIIVDADGEPKLLDFGIAKVVTGDDVAATITALHAQMLTPACASPEQARGETITAASDIYALGALLFEMLAGRPAHRFSSKSPSREEVARVICGEAPPAPSVAALDPETAEEIAGRLDAIVLRAMQKEPENRYASVADFAADIRNYLGGGEPAAVTALERIQRRTRETAPRRMAWLYAAAAALLLGATAAVWLWQNPADNSSPPSDATWMDPRGIAVLPFENLSTAAENAFFAAGVHDAILTGLAKIAELKVTNPTSVRHYSSTVPRDLTAIGQQLHVAYVLEGSVQRAGNEVRVTAKLSDTRTGAQVWAEQYDRELADVFAIQSEIADRIADQLRVQLSPEQRAAKHDVLTRDIAAYELYLRALERDRGPVRTREDIDDVVQLLDEAVARDPRFVAAWCLLARTHLRTSFLNLDTSPQRLEAGRRAVAAASEVAPDAGEVHLAQATLFYWGHRDYRSALDRLALARRSLPNDAYVPFFTALIKRRQGAWEESTEFFREAAVLDPRNTNILFELSNSYRSMRQYERAAAVLDYLISWNEDEFLFHDARALVELSWRADVGPLQALLESPVAALADADAFQFSQLNAAFAQRDYAAAQAVLDSHSQPAFRSSVQVVPREYYQGLAAQGLGQVEQARLAFEQARVAAEALVNEQPQSGRALMMLADIEAHLGNFETARRMAEKAVRFLPVTDDAPGGTQLLTNLASVYVRIGEKYLALTILEQSAKLPHGVSYGSLKLDDAWDPLRQEPRFQKLVQSLAPAHAVQYAP